MPLVGEVGEPDIAGELSSDNVPHVVGRRGRSLGVFRGYGRDSSVGRVDGSGCWRNGTLRTRWRWAGWLAIWCGGSRCWRWALRRRGKGASCVREFVVSRIFSFSPTRVRSRARFMQWHVSLTPVPARVRLGGSVLSGHGELLGF